MPSRVRAAGPSPRGRPVARPTSRIGPNAASFPPRASPTSGTDTGGTRRGVAISSSGIARARVAWHGSPPLPNRLAVLAYGEDHWHGHPSPSRARPGGIAPRSRPFTTSRVGTTMRRAARSGDEAPSARGPRHARHGSWSWHARGCSSPGWFAASSSRVVLRRVHRSARIPTRRGFGRGSGRRARVGLERDRIVRGGAGRLADRRRRNGGRGVGGGRRCAAAGCDNARSPDDPSGAMRWQDVRRRPDVLRREVQVEDEGLLTHTLGARGDARPTSRQS